LLFLELYVLQHIISQISIFLFVTVFQLLKSKLNNEENSAREAEWYALALNACSESIHTSHERDRSHFQEEMETFSVPPVLRVGKNLASNDRLGCFATTIPISESMRQRLSSAPKGGRKVEVSEEQPMPIKSTFNRPVPKKKTVTSARNFFGANNKNSSTALTKSTKKDSCGIDKSSSTANTTSNEAKAANKPRPAAKASQSNTLSFRSKKKNAGSNGKKIGNVDEEKENVQNKSSKKVGNADDFVGDMDEEDGDEDDNSMKAEENNNEEEEELQQRSRSKAKAAPRIQQSKERARPKKVAKRAGELEDSDDDRESASTNAVEGAMDAFAKKVSKVQNSDGNNEGTKQRRRRKTMVEKTYMDETGYFHTETQAVWEDVPSDEDDPVVVTSKEKESPKKKAKMTKPAAEMKQGSLMGFFKKK
jgi:hypothetical protein